jgi:hypothetical protein
MGNSQQTEENWKAQLEDFYQHYREIGEQKDLKYGKYKLYESILVGNNTPKERVI